MATTSKVSNAEGLVETKVVDWSKSTYSGADISVIATLNFSVLEKQFLMLGDEEKEHEIAGRFYSKDNLETLKGLVHELGTVQTISCQAHRPKAPVRALGNVHARGYTRGPRTIAGSMIFTVLNQHALRELTRQMEKVIYGTEKSQVVMLADQILPLDLTLLFANEYGNISRMALYGVEFMNSGQTMSIEDLLLEEVIQFVALDMDPMSDSSEIRNQGKGQAVTTGTMLLKQDYVTYQRLLERSGLRRVF